MDFPLPQLPALYIKKEYYNNTLLNSIRGTCEDKVNVK